MTKFETELLKKLDVLNERLKQIDETLNKECFDWNKVFEPKSPKTDNDDTKTIPIYPQYEKIPYWMQPGFKWPEITCTYNKANN